MNFIDAVKSVFTKFTDFNGRARRSEYWWFFLFNVILSFITGFVDEMMDPGGLGIIGIIVSLGLLVPGLAVAIRRMHDVGKSGWFILIPIYNLILAFTEGDKGPNEYGEDPKANM
ncbi:MAG: DUF805 domain-containing protein [Lacibacter sp.]|nr:DUF805 domain-containing protein [Lacibacter sp.]